VTNTSELHLDYKDVIHSIDNLPGGECLKMYSVGYKYREIADNLHIRMSSVKMNIHRLRKKLQR
jgi:DNA-directed RNA polymerase specialized sigma24 family protein